jgi:hypothetical protein
MLSPEHVGFLLIMATEQFATLASSTIVGGIDSIDTEVEITDVFDFPIIPQFRIRIDDELLKVTAVNTGTSTWTITRAEENTTAAIHAAGATVTHVLTAESLLALGRTNFFSEVADVNTTDFVEGSVGIFQDSGSFAAWIPGESETIYYGPITKVYPFDPGPGEFASPWVNTNSVTFDNYRASPNVVSRSITTSGTVSFLTRPPVSSTNFTAEIIGEPFLFPGNTSRCGLVVRESASGKMVTFGWTYDGGLKVTVDRWTNATTYDSNVYTISFADLGCPKRLRLRRQSGNIDAIVQDLHGWKTFTLYTEAVAAFLTPDDVGLFVTSTTADSAKRPTLIVDSWRLF